MSVKIPRALTIAGSDSSGGAGIQADLKTFSALGVYALCAVTALTSQNTLGVNGIVEIDPDFVSSQIRSVVLDIGVDAVKTGMLCNAAIVSRVASDVEELRIKNLVVDPVMISTRGDRLLDEDAIEMLATRLFPLALVVTPNLHEAEVLTGMRVECAEDMRRAAVSLWRLGCGYVVIKGGHLRGNPIDLLYDGTNFYEYPSTRHATVHTHGTGCTFASAVAAFIARGSTVSRPLEGPKHSWGPQLHKDCRSDASLGRSINFMSSTGSNNLKVDPGLLKSGTGDLVMTDRIRVLLIDDDQEDFLIVSDLLSEAQNIRFKLDWVRTYEAGLEAVCRQEHDVYLLDYFMGSHNRLDLLKTTAKAVEPP